MPRTTFAAILLLAMAGCSDSTGPTVEDGVGLRLTPVGLEATNHRTATIYYITMERGTAAVVDWIPCTDPGTCPSVDAGERKTISYDDILGWDSEATEVLFYWWHLVPGSGDELRPDSIRGRVVGG